MKKDWAKKHEKKAMVQPEEILPFIKDDEIVVMTEDCKCVFLDRVNNKCVVYNDRPEICRKYGRSEDIPCKYIKPNGNPRSPAQVKRVSRQVDKQLTHFMQRLAKEVER